MDTHMVETGNHIMLTTEQFAERMGVCVKTVHNWRTNQRLINGRHYLAEKDTVRFPWPLALLRLMDDLFAEGMAGSKRRGVVKHDKTHSMPIAKPKHNNTARNRTTVKVARFNSDYGRTTRD